MRTVPEILASQEKYDPIKIFKLPEHHYAQECRFVPRENGESEDDGWVLSYIFDEARYLPPPFELILWTLFSL